MQSSRRSTPARTRSPRSPSTLGGSPSRTSSGTARSSRSASNSNRRAPANEENEMNLRPIIGAVALAAAVAAPALAQDAATVRLTIKDHRFEPAEVRVPAGKPITLQVKNADPTPEEFESKTLRVEKVIAGNGEATIQLRALQPGR